MESHAVQLKAQAQPGNCTRFVILLSPPLPRLSLAVPSGSMHITAIRSVAQDVLQGRVGILCRQPRQHGDLLGHRLA